jgi:S1-C subfamily serine protease
MLRIVLCLMSLTILLSAQEKPHHFTQVEACRKFTPSIVGIQATQQIGAPGGEAGSGFIVSPDGWILTAAHVVINLETRQNYPIIQVVMPNGKIQTAVQMTPIPEALLHDFALLKVEGSNLPFLQVGNEDDIPVGANFALIGLPLSTGIAMKFCLSGTVVAKASSVLGRAKISIVFFQGVSIKGISGAPMISLDSGKVIGIEDIRLTGIGPALEQTQKELAAGAGSGVIISGIDFGPVLRDLVNTLDNQLANGLGAGNGASVAGLALKEAQREYEKKK